MVWESVVPELGVELHSAYSGKDGSCSRVEHLVFSTALVDIETEEPDPTGWSVLSDWRRSMYNHLLRLHELLEQSGYSARIRLLGRFERLRAWGPTTRLRRLGG
jgi:hypothetical protein